VAPGVAGPVLKELEPLLGKYVIITRGQRKKTYSIFSSPSGVVIVVKYAQVAPLRKLLKTVKDKLCYAEEQVTKLIRKTVMFDCDTGWEECNRVEEVKEVYECREFEVCCQRDARGEGRHTVCSAKCGYVGVGVEVLALVDGLKTYARKILRPAVRSVAVSVS